MSAATAGVRCELISLEAVYELSFQLALAVRASGFQPERVVAVARGGLVPARLLCDFLQIRDVLSLTVRHYAAGARRQGAARLEVPLAADIAGCRVLVVDDVNDSGDTLGVARKHVERSGAGQTRCAVLHEKTGSRTAADYRAVTLEQWRWLIYEWALVEDVVGFLSGMDPPPLDQAEALRRLEADYGLRLEGRRWEKVARLAPELLGGAR